MQLFIPSQLISFLCKKMVSELTSFTDILLVSLELLQILELDYPILSMNQKQFSLIILDKLSLMISATLFEHFFLG